MSLRDAIRNNPAVVVIVLAIGVITGVVYYYLLMPSGPRIKPRATHQWFYDLGKRELYIVAMTEMAPVDPPSHATGPDGSPGGVKAHVFSCGSCADAQTQFIGYLESYTPEGRAALLETRRPGAGSRPMGAAMMAATQGRLVARGDAAEWIAGNGKDATAIIAAAAEKCGKGKAEECLPAGPR